MSVSKPRALIIGLDSVSPWLLHERFRTQTPRIQSLIARSQYGTLRSIDPPITVPAWAVMFSGVDPGTLGIYGFRHRRPGSYFDQYTPTSRALGRPMVWDLLSQAGKRVCVLGMPPGYPPPRVNGVYVSDFLTPDDAQDYVSPASLRPELEQVTGGYVFDVLFRAADRERVGGELIAMTRKHFAAARHLWAKEPWDLFALHEIGPDRIHHAFWKFFDPRHPEFQPGSPLGRLAEEYYRTLDEEVGRLLDIVPEDVQLLLLSDHGSQAMDGCFCINEWLIEQGYLVVPGPRPKPGTPLENLSVDWTRTRAWGSGGYYARIFLNVRGREPQGCLEPSEVEAFVNELVSGLRKVQTPTGSPLAPDVRVPKSLYREVRGDAPDLMAYFGDLRWRSAGTLGHDGLFLKENDTGPDDSVHSFDGIYVVPGPPGTQGSEGPTRSLIDIAPSLLRFFGLPVGPQVQGRVLEGFFPP